MSLAAEVVGLLKQRGETLSFCESLTAGLGSATIAEVPGASVVLRGGLVTYATDLKSSLAGVDADHLEETGPIDPVVAAQMAVGAAKRCVADIGTSCTGVAGPDPQDDKPVGLVYTAIAFGGKAKVFEHEFTGDRNAIRNQTVQVMAVNLDEFVTELAFGPPSGREQSASASGTAAEVVGESGE